jgi:hypothetical protein
MTQTRITRPSLTEGIQEPSPVPRAAGGSGGIARRNILFAGGAAVLAMILLVVVIGRAVAARAQDPGVLSRFRPVIDSETGKLYEEFRISEESAFPWRNPETGRDTLYPAEACFWTKDGGAKLEPTYVLLNSFAGREGPTLCPDCGKPVVAHNPLPPVELLEAAAKAAGKN